VITPQSRHERRLLALIFIGIFFLIAPLLIWYASGYGIPIPQQGSWLPGPSRSAINISSKPNARFKIIERATGNIVSEGNTPWIGLDFAPGNYQIVVEEENYLTYTQNVTLQPGRGWQPPPFYLIKDSPWRKKIFSPESITQNDASWIWIDSLAECITWENNMGRFSRTCIGQKILGTKHDFVWGWAWSRDWLIWVSRNNNEVLRLKSDEPIRDVLFDAPTSTFFILANSSLKIWRVIPTMGTPLWSTSLPLPTPSSRATLQMNNQRNTILLKTNEEVWERVLWE